MKTCWKYDPFAVTFRSKRICCLYCDFSETGLLVGVSKGECSFFLFKLITVLVVSFVCFENWLMNSSYYYQNIFFPSSHLLLCLCFLSFFFFLPVFHFVTQLFCRIACAILWGKSSHHVFSYEMEIKTYLFLTQVFIPSFTRWNGIITVSFNTFPDHFFVL